MTGPESASQSSTAAPLAASDGYVDEGLVKAMTPVTERTIRRSVELNPKILAEALFPIMAPAIRRSIGQALETMVQSLNSAVENSLSPQSVRWRVEAWRTGKTFAEVVVVRTLLFRVEQVFLIEKTSGLLLQHAAVDPALTQNSEIISGMLTAIQDFVQDSFRTPENQGIGTVEIGETALWIETGPQAVLAAVIRGNPPQDLRDVFHDTLVAIHQDHLKPLASYGGHADDFASTRELLDGCLRQQRLTGPAVAESAPAEGARPSRRLTPFHYLAAAVLAGVTVWGVISWREAARWERLQRHLAELPGVVIIRTEKSGGKYRIEGLRDPLAADPLAALHEFQIPPSEVAARWRPYQSLDEEIVRRRAQQSARAAVTEAAVN